MAVMRNGDLGVFPLEPTDGSDGKWGFGDVHSGNTGKLPWAMWWFTLETNDSHSSNQPSLGGYGCGVLILGRPGRSLRDLALDSCPPDTIRKMKVDFRHMEAEMDDLAANMAAISASSARVSAALQDRHRRGAQLAGTERGRSREIDWDRSLWGRSRGWVSPRFGRWSQPHVSFCSVCVPTPFLPDPVSLQGCRRCCGSCRRWWRCRGGCGAGRGRSPLVPCAATPAPAPSCATTATCPPSVPSRTRATPSWPSWPSASAHASGAFTLEPDVGSAGKCGFGGVHSGAY